MPNETAAFSTAVSFFRFTGDSCAMLITRTYLFKTGQTAF